MNGGSRLPARMLFANAWAREDNENHGGIDEPHDAPADYLATLPDTWIARALAGSFRFGYRERRLLA